MKLTSTITKYLLSFFFAAFFFIYAQNVYAHDNAGGTCTHIRNQWVSCGSANRCEGPDLVNDWETCYIDADGNHSDCSTIANDLHQANAPQCAPKVCPDKGWGSSPGSYCGAQCVSCGVTSDRYYDSDCNCVTTGTFSDPSYCTDLCPITETPTSSPTPSMPPPTATSKPPTPASSPPPTKVPTLIPGASPTPTKATTPIPGASATPTSRPGTPTPTRVPACNVNCVRDSDCQGARDLCNVCINNRCQRPPTPTPMLTPTPPFNPAACKCDGIDYSPIFSGQPVTITSYGKVEGADISKARIVDQKFFFAEGAETLATIIGRSQPIPATIIQSTATKVRYQSQWKFTTPQLKVGATYRIWSQINCQPKLNALNYTPVRSKAVLAESTESENLSFFDRILRFLNNLFGGVEQPTAQPTPTPYIPVGTSELNVPTPTGRESLQLETIYPAEVYQKTCSFIKFRYDPFGQ